MSSTLTRIWNSHGKALEKLRYKFCNTRFAISRKQFSLHAYTSIECRKKIFLANRFWMVYVTTRCTGIFDTTWRNTETHLVFVKHRSINSTELYCSIKISMKISTKISMKFSMKFSMKTSMQISMKKFYTQIYRKPILLKDCTSAKISMKISMKTSTQIYRKPLFRTPRKIFYHPY